jgi:hypothetical protein
MAQGAGGGGAADPVTDPVKPVKPSYMMVGGFMALDYFFSAGDTTENYGILVKAPVNNSIGVQASLGSFNIPLENYTPGGGAAITNGFGHEEFANLQLDFLYYFAFNRHFQIKAGFDYYRYVRGEIINEDTAANGSCGQVVTTCYKCAENLFGMNLGLNMDVPIYKDLYLMSQFGTRYIFNSNTESFPFLELSLGLGFKI